MGRIIDLVVYCQSGKGRYKAFYEEKADGEWYGIRAEKMPDLSFFEKLSLKNQHKSGLGSILGLKRSGNKASSEENFHGLFYWDIECPICGNRSYVKCGRCGNISCWDRNSSYYSCGVCGNWGEVRGTISDLNANLG